MSTIPNKDQQIEALWKALQSEKYWVAVDYTNRMRLLENEGGEIGRIIKTFEAPTREEVIARLIVHQTAERLA